MPDPKNAGVTDFLRSYLRSGMVVLDVGANIGDVTCVAAECVSSSGHVIAFEASPANVQALRERFVSISNVEVRHAAVSDQSGTLELHLDAESSKRHSLFASIVSVPGESVVVPALKLDDMRNEIGHVDLIKIDAQGAEARILCGAQSLLARDRPVILFELWPGGMAAAGTSPADLFGFLDSYRYRYVRLSVKGRQKSRESIDKFLSAPSRWASTNIIAWPPAPPRPFLERVKSRLFGR